MIITQNHSIIDSINKGKWWRLFDLKGLKLKLKKPICTFAHPYYKGDRNYIIISKYLYPVNHENSEPPYTYSDWVLYGNEIINEYKNHSINLAALDLEYFYNLLTKKNV